MIPNVSMASPALKVVLGSLAALVLLAGDRSTAAAQASGASKKKASGDPAKEAPKGDGQGKTSTAGVDADALLVKEKLKDLLHPTAIEFLDDGRVKMEFDFRQKTEEHGEIFNVPVGAQLQDVFRWTRSDEERVVGGDPGLRVSDRGSAVLKAWFKDDLEAEMEFLQHINFDARQIAAVAFVNAKGAGVGTNYGSQCAQFAGGRMGRATGRPTPVAFNNSARIKLVLRDGAFEAHRDGRQLSKSKYSPKSLTSGQIAFVWGGSISGTITKLTVTGRIDNARMAEQMRKTKK
jgi:hypothetical protein